MTAREKVCQLFPDAHVLEYCQLKDAKRRFIVACQPDCSSGGFMRHLSGWHASKEEAWDEALRRLETGGTR